MRGLKTDRTVSVVIQGHAFVQNLRRGHYELGIDAAPVFRLATAFDELQPAIDVILSPPTIPHALRSPNATVPYRISTPRCALRPPAPRSPVPRRPG